MKRAFFSLYVFIALTIAGTGWALDYLWESYQPSAVAASKSEQILEVLSLASHEQPLEFIAGLVESMQVAGLVNINLLPVDNLSGHESLDRLQQGETLAFASRDGSQLFYRKVPGHPYLLVAEQAPAPYPWLEVLLGALFYSSLAVAVLFWLWPLTRDMHKLEKHVRHLGTNGEYPEVILPPTSAAYNLAQSFNHMTRRIRELLRMQKEMTHAVSHELRTPLARMKFALAMAADDAAPPALQEHLQGMQSDVLEMDGLVSQLLNYARLEQHQPSLDWKPGDLAALTQEIINRLIRNLVAPPEILVENGVQEAVVCDWLLLERALSNLIENALRHCDRRICVRLFSDALTNSFAVEDDGQGVPAEQREAVFESFVRLRRVHEKQGAGLGLGLAIVSRVAHWHGGGAYVEGSELGGARFVLHWPQQRP